MHEIGTCPDEEPKIPEILLTVTLKFGMWTVMVNDQFYGDYSKKNQATAAAMDKQRDIIAGGGRARVVLP